jgi:UDPglucose 6-dehydrogenase
MRVLIIGTGYVGLVTGACLAEVGHEVLCLDIDAEKIDSLKQGVIPIYEPLLGELVQTNLIKQKLQFTTCYETGLHHADIILIAVATPSRFDGTADLSYIQAAAVSIAKAMKEPRVLAIKSTVPPGTSQMLIELIEQTLASQGKSIQFDLISNPEFLREGCAVHDCMHPERIIIGSNNSAIKSTIQTLYAPFNMSENQLIFMDLASAEMTKYAANAMLAARISFMNELSGLCEKLGANIEHVRVGIGSDSRIGPQFLCAGVGFGGSCFPKDIRALKAKAREVGYTTPILNAIEEVNNSQKKILGEKIKRYFAPFGGLTGKTIAIWGLSFKPNTDDIREAPALELIKELRDLGATLRLFDPAAMSNAQNVLVPDKQIQWCYDEYDASLGADAIALLTEWKQFKTANLQKVLASMNGKALFDGRNQYLPQEMNKYGFDYFAIGISKVN